jgi:hypothetical protein
MRWFAALVTCSVIAGCVPAQQPESARTVAAYEVLLQSEQDRTEFLSVVSRVAEAEGLHLDSATLQELQRTAEIIPAAEMTIHAAVWRGSTDDDAEAVIMDGRDHLGQVWIMFSRGEDPRLATRFRERAMREIVARWPDTLSLPIMPNGAIPLHRDLVRTPDGYIVDPSAASRYSKERSS